MPIRFVIDEHLRGRLLKAIHRHNATGGGPVDALEVGEPDDLPLGTKDPDLLLWAERNGRIVLTLDVTTMPTHLASHLAAGRRSPGVMAVRGGTSFGQVVAYLELATHAGDPADYADAVTYIP